MIKIKIKDPFMGKNRISFHGFYMMKELFRDYSIDITNSDDYDYALVGQASIIDKKKSLEESIEKGLEFVSKITGDYFLFDGSDSTSLMGAYEVLDESKAIYLFKNQLLNREEYKKPTTLNKWFFGTGSDLDLSYNILFFVLDHDMCIGRLVPIDKLEIWHELNQSLLHWCLLYINEDVPMPISGYLHPPHVCQRHASP